MTSSESVIKMNRALYIFHNTHRVSGPPMLDRTRNLYKYCRKGRNEGRLCSAAVWLALVTGPWLSYYDWFWVVVLMSLLDYFIYKKKVWRQVGANVSINLTDRIRIIVYTSCHCVCVCARAQARSSHVASSCRPHVCLHKRGDFDEGSLHAEERGNWPYPQQDDPQAEVGPFDSLMREVVNSNVRHLWVLTVLCDTIFSLAETLSYANMCDIIKTS